MKKTKQESGYTQAKSHARSCDTCSSMNKDGTCDKVKGIVRPTMVCRLFTRRK